MGLSDREYYQENSSLVRVRKYGSWSAVAIIILLNVALFFIDQMMGRGALFSKLCLTGEVAREPFQWYRCLTYGFAHDPSGFMHIFCNMLTLFFFGPVLERIYGKKEFLFFYLGSVFFGGITWNVLHCGANMSALGASGGITAVVALFACKFPKNIIMIYGIIPFPAWLAGVLYIAYDAFGAKHGMDNVAHDIHLAGAAFALFYFFSGIQLSRIFSRTKKNDKRKYEPSENGREKVNERMTFSFEKGNTFFKKWDKDALENEVDRILLKYNRCGKESLTKEEEDTLVFASKEFQKWKK